MSSLLYAEVRDDLTDRARRRINKLLNNPKGLPNGKNRRVKLGPRQKDLLQSEVIHAVGHASVYAINGPLPNRVQSRGRPPDNAVFIFIDDIWRACEAAGIKPGLRYVSGSESLPVQLYIDLASLLWPRTKNPRRLFERWQRHRSSLVRTLELPSPARPN
jgi:hypothetical protein